MALLAEELVEEWLNRQGYFTIRGIKVGVDEIDLLALRFDVSGQPQCRHIEVQASIRPVSYVSKVPKKHLEAGQVPSSAKARSPELLETCVKEWVFKKYRNPKKIKIIQELFPQKWKSELVANNVKYEEELGLIEKEGIRVIRLGTIIKQLNEEKFRIKSASGADFADLIQLAAKNV